MLVCPHQRNNLMPGIFTQPNHNLESRWLKAIYIPWPLIAGTLLFAKPQWVVAGERSGGPVSKNLETISEPREGASITELANKMIGDSTNKLVISKVQLCLHLSHLPLRMCLTYNDFAFCSKYRKYLTRSSLLMFS